MKLLELFSDESKWTQCAMARNSHGAPTSSESPSATCWCLAGGVKKCYPDHPEILSLIKTEFTAGGRVTYYNDSKATFDDIQVIAKRVDEFVGQL